MSVESMQEALRAEHAAVWTYGLVSAFISVPQQVAAVADGANAHRARRDVTERWLRDAGATPQPPAAAYLAPQPVDSAASAIAALVSVETDACVAWRGVLERTEDGTLRTSALDALTVAAVRATRWRKAAGLTPASIPFPGAGVG
ncbi:hypothetical protein F4560_004999 [Saccharothrix ecbatanensis]|uniref:DUF4439 domain-containing protein n=1 Tax=Saccharothrix ecbatanensis TaxID=1105145 RepID=A0A7W9HN96_9PSEU|nr:ferritin-like domain-containing protein [Saccharothrix ecbatanensis]MBB5805231.1 hypothetical protein [Saccharothrix ecbatanensis]